MFKFPKDAIYHHWEHWEKFCFISGDNSKTYGIIDKKLYLISFMPCKLFFQLCQSLKLLLNENQRVIYKILTKFELIQHFIYFLMIDSLYNFKRSNTA